jgi:hypothetical protein
MSNPLSVDITGKSALGNHGKSLIIFLLATLLFFLTVISFFPGGMNADTLVQLAETSTGRYSDEHPPIMAALWRILFVFWDNVGTLFIFHNLFYWFLLFVFSCLAFQGLKARALIMSFGAFPSMWTQAVAVIKDTELSICVFGAYLFALSAKLLERGPTPAHAQLSKISKALAWLFFFYSAAVRWNSLPLLVPLCWYLLAKDGEKTLTWRRGMGVLGMILACFAAIYLFDYGILKAQKFHIFQECEIFDITGIYVRTGDENFIPKYWKEMNADVSPQTLLLNYKPETLVNLLFTGLVHLTGDPERLDDLRRQWWGAIRRHPLAYLEQRWGAFRGLLRLGEKQSFLPYQLEIRENNMGLEIGGDPQFKALLVAYFSAFQNTILFKGWPYLLAILLVLTAHALEGFPTNPFKLASLCSALSAFFYGIGYFFYSLSSDFRFWYPVVILTVFSTVLYLKGRISSKASV